MSAASPFWTGVFRVKGIWNCVLSVLFLFGEVSLRDRLGVPHPDPAYRAMVLALSFTFGLGYWRVGQGLTTNRDIIRGGVIGQTAVFVVLANEVLIERRLPLLFLVPGLADLFFAVLFTVFLVQTRGEKTEMPALPVTGDR
jgi:hypothetical protein